MSDPIEDNHTRFVTFLRIVDGDTFHCRMVLLQHVKPQPQYEGNIRVFGWNAAELSEDEGPWMRDHFEALLLKATRITVTVSTMSFERMVAIVWLDGVRFDGILHTALRSFQHRRAAGQPHPPAAAILPID